MSRSYCTIEYAKKKLGQLGEVKENDHGQVWVKYKDYIVSFIKNGDHASCYHTRRFNDHDDLQSDYHAGSYWDNISQAIRYVKKEEIPCQNSL